jgi:glycosyltransferase involved in cell wall biosynthesis
VNAKNKRRPLTVLQVLPAFETGGAERGAIDVARALVDSGSRAIVVSAGGPMLHEIDRTGAEHVMMPVASKNPLVMLANVGRLRRLIEAAEVDIVHARSRAPAWSALRAARRTHRPFVTTFHGTYNYSGPVKRWYNSVMARGDRVIAISNFIADHVRANYGVGDDRLRVVPRGIDLSIFDPAKVSPLRMINLATGWRIPDDARVVMLPGRLTRWKGQALLIEALAILRRDNLRCLIIGSDQGRAGYKKEIEERVRSRGLESTVHIVEHCRDMPAAYMLADVVVSASTDPEAFGRVVVEAQAMGRPTVASDHGGARETLISGETGWLFAPGDAADLAVMLDRVLALTPAERDALAAKSIRRARATFSRERMCELTLDVYHELVEGDGAGAVRAEK